jgi:hypothetical protein
MVWMGAESLAPTGIRSLDRQAHSKSACANCGRNCSVFCLLVEECETTLTFWCQKATFGNAQCGAEKTECDLVISQEHAK